jgi:hypothetical protein
MHGNVEKNLDDNLPLQGMAYVFLHIYSREVFQENIHLLILNGHGSHIIIQVLEQTTKLGLDMVTLTSHIHVACVITIRRHLLPALQK